MLNPWEPLPPQARVRPRLEQAAGLHRDLSRLERARRLTAGEVARAYREHFPSPAGLTMILVVEEGYRQPRAVCTMLRRVVACCSCLCSRQRGLWKLLPFLSFRLWSGSRNSANCADDRGVPTSGSRPCAHAASVLFEREREGASDSVHRQSCELPVAQQRRVVTVQTLQMTV